MPLPSRPKLKWRLRARINRQVLGAAARPFSKENSAIPDPETQSHRVEPGEVGRRLDVWLAARPGAVSRHQAQLDIEAGRVRVNGRTQPSRYKLRDGDLIEIEARPETPGLDDLRPSDIPLNIVYEDEHLLVIDKPAGVVVHPAPGHVEGTLANALLAHAGPPIADVGGPGRCGIVHRLDKLTSGLLVAAKTQEAHEALTSDLAERKIQRIYLGIALGNFTDAEGEIEKPIGRRSSDRKLMGVVGDGREAKTSYKVLLQTDGIALLLLRLHTGRTHQIRVHLQSIGRPILGDAEYGYTKLRSLQMLKQELRNKLGPIWPERQMLHAAGLKFKHPVTGEVVLRVSEPPEDMRRVASVAFESGELERGHLARALAKSLEG